MRPTVLYQATNKTNGFRYIGITVRPLDVRRRRHEYDARSGSPLPFHRALRKYGGDAFEWRPLAVLQSQQDAAETEVRAIALFKPEYNAHPGGTAGPFPPDSNTIKRIAQRHFKSVVCLDTGELFPSVSAAAKFCGRGISAVLSGREVSANGHFFVLSDKKIPLKKRRRLIADGMARKESREEKLRAARRKSVVCLTSGIRYVSAAEAARQLAIDPTSIGQCCTGKLIKAHGLRFVFEEDFISGKFDRYRQKKESSLTRKVTCISTGMTYKSVCAAARDHGTTSANVRLTCQGKRRIAGGVEFRYVGDETEIKRPSIKRAVLTVAAVSAIRALPKETPRLVVADQFNISLQTVADVTSGRTWKELL